MPLDLRPVTRSDRRRALFSVMLLVSALTALAIGVPPALGSTDSIAARALALDPVVTGLSQPVFYTQAPDTSNRFFVVERTGTIRIVVGGQVRATFLDVT